MPLRDHLIGLLCKAAAHRPNMLFLTGDLGFSVVEPLQVLLGDRFINAGVAEANMISTAASLSACGFEPFVYSITPFVTARCYEQLRNDVCYGDARVRIIGVGAGFSYGTLGPTHHALEDATIMATLPGMTVFSPATVTELDSMFDFSDAIDGPIYYRIGRENGPEGPGATFEQARPVVTWAQGTDINVVTSGSLAGEVLAAVESLTASGIRPRLITVPVLAPFPASALENALAPAPVLVAFEGYDSNPLECGVAKLLAERCFGHAARFLNAGRSFAKQVGNTSFQRERFSLDAGAIAAAALQLLRR